jgi:hypothetical protein
MVSTPRWLGWPARKPSGYKWIIIGF